jgi:hypothetical protein
MCPPPAEVGGSHPPEDSAAPAGEIEEVVELGPRSVMAVARCGGWLLCRLEGECPAMV